MATSPHAIKCSAIKCSIVAKLLMFGIFMFAVGARAQNDAWEFVPGSWTMVVIPDTQAYTDVPAWNAVFIEMTEWIRDNRDANSIQVVLHEGDIVQHNYSDSNEWARAVEAMSVLDGEVPYVLSVGNHDLGTNNSAGDRFTRLNDYFSATNNSLVDPAQGGILTGTYEPNRLDNAYYTFTAPDNRKMLIFSLEFGPRQAVVDWAAGIAGEAQYTNHTAVLLTHAYMYDDDTRYDWAAKGASQTYNPHAYGVHPDCNDGEELWNELVKTTGNFKMTFNGHVCCISGGDMLAYLADEDDTGGTVHQMLFNAQTLSLGGNGWLRLIEFLPGGKQVQVRTYSPWLDAYRTGSVDQFRIDLTASDYTEHILGMAGLAAYYRFEEDAGIAADNAENTAAFDGVITGITLPGSNMDGPTELSGFPGMGAGNSAFDFDGTNDYITVGSTLATKIDGPSTVALFVQLDSTDWARMWDTGDGVASNNYMTFGSHSGGAYIDVASYQNGSVGQELFNAAGKLNDGGWHHVVVTRAGSGLAINELAVYIDGKVLDWHSHIGSSTIRTGYPRIGADSANGTAAEVNGRLDDIAIFNTALSAGDVKKLYDAARQQSGTLMFIR